MSDETAASADRTAAQQQPRNHPPAQPGQGRDGPGGLPAALGPGNVIAGYRIEEQVGQGGMAAVYRAHDERLGRAVALKLLTPALATDSAFRQRFIRESRAASAVDHPNIIPVYEAGDADGILFIAMRYVHGGDAGSLVRREGALAPPRAWAIVSQVASALDAAHGHGLIHRDVKPANILLDAGTATGWPGPGGAGVRAEHVYLSDFGISKQSLAATGTLTQTGQFVGTLGYIAPEQLRGGPVDGRADLYSLGCAAFELLSGSPPFRRDRDLALIQAHLTEPPPPLTAHRAGMPRAADRVLARAMAKTPAERYGTCSQFAQELGRALGLVGGEPSPPQLPPVLPPAATRPSATRPAATPPAGWALPPAGPVPPDGPGWPQPPPRRRSRGLVIAVVAAVAVLLAAGAAAAVYLSRHQQAGVPAPAPTGTAPPTQQAPATSAPPATAPAPAAPNPAASAQAAAISTLLQTGHGSSVRLSDAAAGISTCTDVPQNVQAVQQVRDQRQAEYGQAQGLATGALPDGAQLKASLLAALRDSLTADDAYLTWAQQQAANCQPGSQPAGTAAADATAVSSKKAFLRRWNPLAAQYGLPRETVATI